MQRRLLGFFITTITCLVTLSGCGVESTPTDSGSDQGNQFISVSGTVSLANGSPAKAISVIYANTGESVTTDQFGTFAFSSVAAAEPAQFILESDSFSIAKAVTFASSSDSALVDFVISADLKSVTASVNSMPAATPTPGAGGSSAFDQNADTTSFGIPSGLKGNVNQGKKIYFSLCSGCHPTILGKRASYSSMRRSLSRAPMSALSVDAQDTAHLVAYLNFIR